MANLISVDYFILDINLPTSDENDVERINAFISKFEPKCLELILGYELAKVVKNETSQRVTDLVDGKEYLNSKGYTVKWQGLIQESEKTSLIANYVYFYFQKANATQTMNNSTAAVGSTGGQSVAPAEKMVSAWNSFASEINQLLSFLWTYQDIYPEFSSDNRRVCEINCRPINWFGI